MVFAQFERRHYRAAAPFRPGAGGVAEHNMPSDVGSVMLFQKRLCCIKVRHGIRCQRLAKAKAVKTERNINRDDVDCAVND